jgi:hypothetical protein
VATLHILGDGSERVVQLHKGRSQIGRGRENDIVLPDAEKGVSRTHAELRFENGRYIIVDLQSQNGTWIDGRCVERADVPFGAEIAIGEYRLWLQKELPASVGVATAPEVPSDLLGDLRIRDVAVSRQPAGPVPAAALSVTGRTLAIGTAALVTIGLAAVVWVSKGGPQSSGTAPAPSTVPADAPAPPAGSSPVATVTDSVAAQAGDSQERPADAGAGPAGQTKPEAFRSAAGAPSRRKPGESVEGWRARGEALEMRYGYSRAALERGDYAAAAGGFEAILLEEPGFRDAPKLLVQAQEGLRASARSLFQAGRKLDTAGEWVGALQKYEQARQIYSRLPGLSDRLQRVREKLREAGMNAFNRGREHEANGRREAALKEYELAIQWLPPDDPNRQIARSRAEQLRRN